MTVEISIVDAKDKIKDWKTYIISYAPNSI